MAEGKKEVNSSFASSKWSFGEITIRSVLLDHSWSFPSIASDLNNCSHHTQWKKKSKKKVTEANNLLRDMNKGTICLLWLIVLRVKSSLLHRIALTMGCFDHTVPWPILLVESLRLSYTPRPLFSLTWTENTYHTTNVCYFRHLDMSFTIPDCDQLLTIWDL